MQTVHRPESDSPPFRSIHRIAIVASLMGLLLISAGCNRSKKAETPPGPPAVTVVEVRPADVPVSVERIAQTQSSHMVNIQARVSGFLDRRLYTEGAMVRKGQVLFQIDPKPFQVQMAQAKAAVSKQETALEEARLELQRIKPLAEENALSKRDLDNANSRYKSELAQLEQAKAQLETARLNLSYTTITSPVSGITGAAQQTEGTYISPQNSLLTTVSTLSPMWVNFSLSENEMQRYRQELAKGTLKTPEGGKYQVEVILSDGTPFPHTGTITFASPTFNSDTGTFLIRASLENPEGVLRPNQFVRVRLKGAIRPNALLLPQRAVQQGPKGHFLWVVGKDKRVEQRPVTVGEWEGTHWLIYEGVKGGESVVVDGGIALHPGIQVTARPFSTAGPPSAAKESGAGDAPASR